MASTKSRIGNTYVSMAVAAIAMAISLVAIALLLQPTQTPTIQTREFYLVTQVDEAIEEDKFGIPPDLFFPSQMTVNKGDMVMVHFFNLEPEETQEHHTFTMASGVYQMHHDLNAGQQRTIEFAATEAGVFDYICALHQPTMRGQLVVLE